MSREEFYDRDIGDRKKRERGRERGYSNKREEGENSNLQKNDEIETRSRGSKGGRSLRRRSQASWKV